VAKKLSKSVITADVVSIVNVFDNQGDIPPTLDQKLWDIGIGSNLFQGGLPQALTKRSHKYEGKMVTQDGLKKATTVGDLVDVLAKAINAGGVYEVK
jgi:hypothetical protein